MACENCGSNYKGNCNCKDPITLVSTGPTGPTGPQGTAGTNGISLLYSSTSSSNSVVGVTSSTLMTYDLDNELVTYGDFIRINGRMRFYDVVNSRACDVKIDFDGVYNISLPRIQVINSFYSYMDFELELKYISATQVTVLLKATQGNGNPLITVGLYTYPIVLTNLTLANTITISLIATLVDTTTNTDIAFTRDDNARLQDANITKYLQ